MVKFCVQGVDGWTMNQSKTLDELMASGGRGECHEKSLEARLKYHQKTIAESMFKRSGIDNAPSSNE